MPSFNRSVRSRAVAALTLATYLSTMVPWSLARADDVPPPPAAPAAPSSLQQGPSALNASDGSVAVSNSLATAEVQPSSGALEATIAFALPTARGDVQPSLALVYNSSSGVGVGGAGWSLAGVPSIERHNPSGAPTFADPKPGQPIVVATQDRFTYGGSPLVAICAIGAAGACMNYENNQLANGEVLPSFATASPGWTYYRLATESGQLLRFFWSADHTQWIVQAKDGSTAVYGAPTQGSSDLTGTDPDLNGHIFRWNVVRRFDAQRDASGNPTNLVQYAWSHTGRGEQPGQGIPVRGYLTDVYDTPPLGNATAATASFAHHTHLVYERGLSRPSDTPIWLATATVALTRVDVTSQDFKAAGQRQQVRRYYLTYADTTAATTAVASATLEGGENGCSSGNNYEDKTTQLLPDPSVASVCPKKPTTNFYYSAFSDSAPTITAVPTLPNVAGIYDLNNDGLPDFLSQIGALAPMTALINSGATSPGTSVSFQTASVPSAVAINGTTTTVAQSDLTAGAFQMSGQLDMLLQHADLTSNNTLPPSGASENPIPYQLLSLSNANGAWQWSEAASGTFGLKRYWAPGQICIGGTIGACVNTPMMPLGDEIPYATLDVNGDRLADLITSKVWGSWQADSNGSGTQEHFYAHRMLAYRPTYRGFDGSYEPFAGLAATTGSVTLATNEDFCVGGDTTFSQLDNGLDKNRVPTKAARTLADVNGDGLPDFVKLDSDPNGRQINYWPGHGDGTFGRCDGPTGGGQVLQCACASAKPNTSNPLPAKEDLADAALHDVNGDGFADLIAPTPTGFHLYYGAGDGLTFTGVNLAAASAATVVDVHTPMGWPANNGQGFCNSDSFSFADMDGNGVDDIVVGRCQASSGYAIVSFSALRPFLLSSMVTGQAGTKFNYDTTANLARTAGPAAWGPQMPQSVDVVTSVQTSIVAGDSYTTSYSYSHPVFDGHDNVFLGFQHVIKTSPGDATTQMNTATTYYYGACGANTGVNCLFGADNAAASYRGLPVLVETYDGTKSVYLSTVHHSYSALGLFAGIDGRVVRRIYDAEQDTFLYDTGSFKPLNLRVTIPDINSAELVVNPGFLVRGKGAQLERTATLDAFGNVQTVTDKGNMQASPAEDVLVSTTTWGTPGGNPGQWIWRAVSTSSGGTANGTSRTYVYGYDGHGNETDVTTSLVGSSNVARWSYGAGQPSGASQDTPTLHLLHATYDQAGNIKTVEVYPSSSSGNAVGRCTEYTYDSAYTQFRTLDAVDVGDCGSASQIVTQRGYDRVLGTTLFTVAPGSERTVMTYDDFGRVLTIAKPDPTSPGATGAPSTTVSYTDTTFGKIIRTSVAASVAVPGGALGLPGYTATDTYVYQDLFGRTIQVVSTSDTAGVWIVSGQVKRDARGRTVATYAPTTAAAAKGDQVPIAAPATAAQTATYDAFSRTLQTADIDGTVTSKTTYHSLSVDSFDAETVKTTGPHAQQFVITTKDGHGRVVSVLEYGNGGSVTTATTYQPTGEVLSVVKTGSDTIGGSVYYARYMRYDSLGRLIVNAEPNASQNFTTSNKIAPIGEKYWSYSYNDLGDLVGTSDPRGCGENLAYDGAGRILSEDYSPCDPAAQQPYTLPVAGSGDGTEAYYVYGTGLLQTGQATDIYDRASHVNLQRDFRGRVTKVQRSIANPGTPAAALAQRYSPTVFTMNVTYDDRDRVQTQSTGTDVSAFYSTTAGNLLGPSTVAASYSPRGSLSSVTSSYGPLITSLVRETDGRLDSVAYADAAKTVTTFAYGDSRRRLTNITTKRTGSFPSVTSSYKPPSAMTLQPTQQTILEDDAILVRDDVGNPTTVDDFRIDSEWPQGSKPTPSRTFIYDDAYRVTSVVSTYSGGGDTFTPPLATNMPHTSPAPMAVTANRVKLQTFAYDGLGNTIGSTDDAQLFFDRSLATITNGNQLTGTGGPNQLLSATDGGGGSLNATYDVAGNLTELDVQRAGPCEGGPCSQRYLYVWDEMGQLAEASRTDLVPPPPCTQRICPNIIIIPPPSADVKYAYDASGARVLRSGKESDGTTTYSAEIFPSLRLNHTSWDPTTSTYARSSDTEAVYLTLGGASYGRVVYTPNAQDTNINGPLHVFLELTDALSSTSTVIDRDTSELVERTTYLPYGQIDSDYRPDRWQDFREDYKFTGKEEDVEVGLTYFGARYYSAPMGRWISPDPLSIHGMSGDLNPYAYVRGRVSSSVDPTGLDGGVADDGYVSNDLSSITYESPIAFETFTGDPDSDGFDSIVFKADPQADVVSPGVGASAPAAAPKNQVIASQAVPLGDPNGEGEYWMKQAASSPGANAPAFAKGFVFGAATGYAAVVVAAACPVCGLAMLAGGLYSLADGGAASIITSVGHVLSGTGTSNDFSTLGQIAGGFVGGGLAPSSSAAPAGGVRAFLADTRGGLRIASGAADSAGALTEAGAQEVGILRDAANGSGNFGLGAADAETAARLGEAWVGDGAKVASDGKTLISSNGLRQFRPPSFKPFRGTFQANFEQRFGPQGPWNSNGHLDILFGPPEAP